MKYEQPYGVTDPNAPYINGNPAIGQQGSIPPAAAFEYPMREIVAMIAASGLTPTDDDLQQLLQSIRSQFVNYGEDAGVANQLSCGFTPPIANYTLGMPFRIRVAATNTGPSTFDGGAGRHPIKHIDGSDLMLGDMPAGGMVELCFDGTNFQMTNFLGQGGGGGGGSTTYNIKIPYIADTSSTANAILAPFTPAITAAVAGDPIEVMIKNTVTGPTTIYVNALPPAPVVNRFGGALRPFDLVQNEIVLLINRGSAGWQIAGQDPADQTVIFKTPGSYVWTCPNGVYYLKKAEVWGAGSSGYNSTVGATSVSPGGTDGPGGNSGGYCCKYNMPVTPGNAYIVVVGQGGAPRNDNGANPGGYSTFGNTLTATGGATPNLNLMRGVGTASGGDINIQGQSGIIVGILTGVHGYIASYGWGAPAPRGGMGGGPATGPDPVAPGQPETAYADGGWPGGGGGGGSKQPIPPPNGHLPGYGGDGGVIITF